MTRHILTWSEILQFLTQQSIKQERKNLQNYNVRQRLDILVKNEENQLYIRFVCLLVVVFNFIHLKYL